jgi:hypothetical protein
MLPLGRESITKVPKASRLVALLALLCLVSACAYPTPSEIPMESDWIVMVKSHRVSERKPFPATLAQHCFFDLKKGGEDRWMRIYVAGAEQGLVLEHICRKDAYADILDGRAVKVLKMITGDKARRIVPVLEKRAERYEDRKPEDYRAWPGPNSNTFIACIIRCVPSLKAELHHNAVGKDYARIAKVAKTTSKTGIAVDTPVLGFAVALREGVEVHFIQMTFGVSLFPPALKIPVLPRIGLYHPVRGWRDGRMGG